MILSSLILLFPAVFSYIQDYKAFDDCGAYGWECGINAGGGKSATYRCKGPFQERNARIWIWTARLPRFTTSFSIADCNHVEIHLDCTTGTRSSSIHKFEAINISHLELLRPIHPYVFLHDNDQIPHAPPEIIFRNIGNLTMYPGVFAKPSGQCRNRQNYLTNILFDNVTIQTFEEGVIHNSLKMFNMTHSIINEIDGTINVKGNVTITNSSFPGGNNFFKLEGNSVVLANNRFGDVGANFFSVKSPMFLFSNNTLGSVYRNAFSVTAHNVTLDQNLFNHLSIDALSNINPGRLSLDDETDKKVSYTFVNNSIKSMDSSSLHPNYQAYEQTCSDFLIRGNKLPCSCPMLNWASPLQYFHNRPFYELFTETNSNVCGDEPDCSLQMAATEYKMGTCPVDTTFFASCNKETVTVIDETERYEDATVVWITEEYDDTPSIYPIYVNPEVMNSSLTRVAETSNPSVIVIPVVVVVLISALAFSYWWYRKRKSSVDVHAVYQKKWRSECEVETLIDE